MSKRITFASLAAAVVLGVGAFLGGSIAASSDAEARGWHDRGRGGGHFGHSWRHPGRHWGGGHRFHGRHWGYRPVYAGFYGGRCFTVIKARFVPGIGLVERPVTRCR